MWFLSEDSPQARTTLDLCTTPERQELIHMKEISRIRRPLDLCCLEPGKTVQVMLTPPRSRSPAQFLDEGCYFLVQVQSCRVSIFSSVARVVARVVVVAGVSVLAVFVAVLVVFVVVVVVPVNVLVEGEVWVT